MGAIGVKCPKGSVSFADCRTCSLDPCHPCGLSPNLLSKLRGEQDNEPERVANSPTRLLGCFRQGVLETENDYYLDIDYQYAALRGHLVHGGIEALAYPAKYTTVQEHRFTLTVDTSYGPQEFSAKPDLIVVNSWEGDTAHVSLFDWKTTDVTHDLVAADIKHVIQINMYAWVVKRCLHEAWVGAQNVVVDEMVIQYLGQTKPRRFSSICNLTAKGKKPRGADEAEVLELAPIRVIPDEKIEQFIRSQIEAKLRAKEVIPAALEGEAAKWCFRCPVYGPCKSIGPDEVKRN